MTLSITVSETRRTVWGVWVWVCPEAAVVFIWLPWPVIVRPMLRETSGNPPTPPSDPPFPHMVLQPSHRGPMEFLSCNKSPKAIFLHGAQTTSARNTWFCWRNLVSLSAPDTSIQRVLKLVLKLQCFIPVLGWGPRKAANDSLITLNCLTEIRCFMWLAN